LEPTSLPFLISPRPAERDLLCDADALFRLLEAAEPGQPAQETVFAASAACAEVLTRGFPAAATLVSEEDDQALVAVRYGPEDAEVLRFTLPLAAFPTSRRRDRELALVLPVNGIGEELAPDLEASFRERHGTTTLACLFPNALGIDSTLCDELAREIPTEHWASLAAPARVHEARRGFAPRSAHPLESHQAGPLAGAPSRFRPGQSLGDYTLRGRLGRGSMGEVWRAHGPEGAVAIKLALRPSFVRHLRQEGLLLAKVDHPHVARFVSADLEHDPPYLVTELVAGQPLRALCRGKLPTSNVVLLCDQLLSGLQAIHDAGILHLDLKPENVIVQPQGGVKILDLGLGRATTRFMEELYLSVSLVSRAPPVAGTLAYMSPEQRKGRELDARADLFAFGILLHELLTGLLPEPGVGVADHRPGLAPRWDVVVARLTHPDLSKRPPSADEARLLVCYTLSEKLRRPVPRGGVRPRDIRSFDEAAFALASPYVPGQVIGDGYELLQPLGRGGFGEVWRAQRGSGEEGASEVVALKLILSDDARPGLVQEAKVAARIAHPNVPSLLGNHAHEEPPHLVFELVHGKSLRLLINEQEEPFELGLALSIFTGQVEVVRACAEADVVHMDLKPEHFLVQEQPGRGPKVTLIDFGLAALLDRAGLQDSLASVNEVRGTLDYMAPEQRRGLTGPEVDVYALGVCLFELLTLCLPQGPQGIRSVRPRVPSELDDLCLRMLSRDHKARPQLGEVEEVVRALRFESSPAAAARRRGDPTSQPGETLLQNPALWAGVLLGLLLLLGWGALTAIPPAKPVRVAPLSEPVASVTTHTLAELVGLLEEPGLVSAGRALARDAASPELAATIGARLRETRAHDPALTGALADQGPHAFPVLQRLRAQRPRLVASLYVRLAARQEGRERALEGVVWILTTAPERAVGPELRDVAFAVRDLRLYGLRVEPSRLAPLALDLDAYLLSAPRHPARMKQAAFLRATLGPGAGTSTLGLESCLDELWAGEVVEAFASQVPADATPAARRSVARLQQQLRARR
jgi:serine/threonine protein kinase